MDDHFLKKIPAWVYVLLGLAIPAITGLITIIDRIWPDRPDVRVYYEEADVNIPMSLRDAQENLKFSPTFVSRSIPGKPDRELSLEEKAIRALTSFEAAPSGRGGVMKVGIHNIGDRAAKNLIINFPGGGLMEIREKGKDVTVQTSSEVKVPVFPPDSYLSITYWSKYPSLYLERDITVAHDDGKVRPVSAIERRKPGKFVVGFEWSNIFSILFLLSMATLFVASVLTLVASQIHGSGGKVTSKNISPGRGNRKSHKLIIKRQRMGS